MISILPRRKVNLEDEVFEDESDYRYATEKKDHEEQQIAVVEGVSDRAYTTSYVDYMEFCAGRNIALTNRLSKEISMVDFPEGFQPLVLWTQSTTGYPETPIFWKKKLLVPCGYQGLLIQK